MLTEIVPEPCAWHGPTLSPDRYLVPIPDACRRELDANYEDHDDPARHRHLVRLWLRSGDRRHFRG